MGILQSDTQHETQPDTQPSPTNSNTDWTKTKQSHASLVHHTGLTNGHPPKRHATLLTGEARHGRRLPPPGPRAGAARRARAVVRRVVAAQVTLNLRKQRLETRISTFQFQALKPGCFQDYGSTGFNLYSPTVSAARRLAMNADTASL
jgi:hypothetical protein